MEIGIALFIIATFAIYIAIVWLAAKLHLNSKETAMLTICGLLFSLFITAIIAFISEMIVYFIFT